MPRTILIADDSVTIRRVVELAFSDTDVRVESAGSGAEALAKFTTLAPDVVLADVVMPEPDGYHICRAVKASARPVPVLLLSGAFEPLDPEEARRCGADGHLVKPFDSRTLVTEVLALLDAGSPAPPAAPRGTVALPPAADDDVDEVFDALAGVRAAPPVAATLPPAPPPTPPAAALSEEAIDAIVERVLARLSDRVVREVAWDVVPDLAEVLVRERLRQIEHGDEVR